MTMSLVHHVVATGDNLTAIAKSHGSTVEAIRLANRRIGDINLIYPGEVIHVPVLGDVPPPPVPSVPVAPPSGEIARIDYTGAARKDGLETPVDLVPFWQGRYKRFSATQSTFPGAQLFDGYTRHKHRASRKGPGIEARGFFDREYDAVRLRWKLQLEDGWSFGVSKFGGKLGGLMLGDNAAGGVGPSETGGSVRLNWRSGDGLLRTYTYHADQPGRYGDADLIDARMPVGRVVDLGLDVYVTDGRVVTWMDGEQIHDSGAGRFRWGRGVGVSGVTQAVRFGGADDAFGPANVCYSRFFGATVEHLP